MVKILLHLKNTLYLHSRIVRDISGCRTVVHDIDISQYEISAAYNLVVYILYTFDGCVEFTRLYLQVNRMDLASRVVVCEVTWGSRSIDKIAVDPVHG